VITMAALRIVGKVIVGEIGRGRRRIRTVLRRNSGLNRERAKSDPAHRCAVLRSALRLSGLLPNIRKLSQVDRRRSARGARSIVPAVILPGVEMPVNTCGVLRDR
jgi:hypothetical protein